MDLLIESKEAKKQELKSHHLLTRELVMNTKVFFSNLLVLCAKDQ